MFRRRINVLGVETLGCPARREPLRRHHDHERVVVQSATRDDFYAPLVERRRHRDLVARSIETFQGSAAEIEVVPARLGEVVELVRVYVHASCGDFVQERLPQMRFVHVHQGDCGPSLACVTIARTRRELQAPGPSADDDDVMWAGHVFSDDGEGNADMIFDADYA